MTQEFKELCQYAQYRLQTLSSAMSKEWEKTFMTEQDTMTLDEAIEVTVKLVKEEYPLPRQTLNALDYIITQARLAERYRDLMKIYLSWEDYQNCMIEVCPDCILPYPGMCHEHA